MLFPSVHSVLSWWRSCLIECHGSVRIVGTPYCVKVGSGPLWAVLAPWKGVRWVDPTRTPFQALCAWREAQAPTSSGPAKSAYYRLCPAGNGTANLVDNTKSSPDQELSAGRATKRLILKQIKNAEKQSRSDSIAKSRPGVCQVSCYPISLHNISYTLTY